MEASSGFLIELEGNLASLLTVTVHSVALKVLNLPCAAVVWLLF